MQDVELGTVESLALALWILAVMAGDWRRRRVPNALLACGLLVTLGPGGGVAAASNGASGAWLSLAVAPLLLASYRMDWIGGGDLKFLLLLPLLGGLKVGLVAFWLGSLLSGAVALLLVGRLRGARRSSDAPLPLTLPYGVAFLCALATVPS